MKKLIQILIVLIGFGVTAQQTTQTNKFVVLTPKVEQLKPILLAAEKLTEKENFAIVLYGANIESILKPEMKNYIRWAAKLDVNLAVCKMSLNKLQIDPASLPKEIEVVENAFLTAFQLQKAGYILLNL